MHLKIRWGRRFACPAALLLASLAHAAAPSYSADSIVKASNFAPGPFAPNSILTIFGSELARSERKLTADDIAGGSVPMELNYTHVLVDHVWAPVLYVSPGQINFILPSTVIAGTSTITVVREGWSGPHVNVAVVVGAPALFIMDDGYAISTHADNSLITADAPARAGEVIVLYATGLGRTAPFPVSGEIPQSAAPIEHLSDLKVWLGGTALDPILIKYAGLTPRSAGLYQINLALPGGTGIDPEIRVSIGNQTSTAGVKLPIH